MDPPRLFVSVRIPHSTPLPFPLPFYFYLSPATMRLRDHFSIRQRKHDRVVQAVQQVRIGSSIRSAMETVNFGAPEN